MCPVPKSKPKASPPPIQAPEIQLGNDRPGNDVRRRAAAGRSQLRTDLGIPTEPIGTGLNIPTQ